MARVSNCFLLRIQKSSQVVVTHSHCFGIADQPKRILSNNFFRHGDLVLVLRVRLFYFLFQ